MTGPKLTRKTNPRDRHAKRCQAMALATAATKAKALDDARAKAEAAFQSQLLSTRVKLWALTDGDDATDVIAPLMVVIGTVCETGAATFGRDAPWVRQLHGALRTLQSLCIHNGYRWRIEVAPVIDAAIDLAELHGRAMRDEEVFVEAWEAANGAAVLVLAHQVDEGMIAGAMHGGDSVDVRKAIEAAS
jgi:hypothetical protein